MAEEKAEGLSRKVSLTNFASLIFKGKCLEVKGLAQR
jgi:hypothetical protein